MESKQTTSINTRRKKLLITHMQDKAGNNKDNIQDVADVFAKFYEEPCTSSTRTHEHEDNHEQLQHRTKPFTMQDPIDAMEAKLQTREESTQR